MGSVARLVFAQLRDRVSSPEPDLLAVLETETAEVGPSGHRLVVVTFAGGEPRLVVDHAVNEPSLLGLVQYEVGSVRVRGREIVARTLVHDASERPSVHVRVDRWVGGEHASSREPLRTEEGRVVEAVHLGPRAMGADGDPILVRLAGDSEPRPLERVRLAEPSYARALREWGSEAPGAWREWIEIDPE